MGFAKDADSIQAQLEQHTERKKRKLEEIRNIQDYMDVQREEIRKRITELNDDLKVRHESINILKGRLTNQITRVKKIIVKVLDKDTSTVEKIQMLFREQGITVTSILTAVGKPIGVLVEALHPSGTADKAGKPLLKDEKGAKEWLRNKLKALTSLLGRLGIKASEVLPGIIGAIIRWVLNRAAEVVAWVSRNLWALVVGIGG